jgi:hypothetical protein
MSTEYERLVALFHSHLEKTDEKGRAALLAELDQYLNPLGARCVPGNPRNREVLARFGAPSRDGQPHTLGGSGQVAQGQTTDLGGGYIGEAITVQVQPTSGVCTVTVQVWMPFAQAPIGCWDIGGPGSKQITLGGTCGGSAPLAGSVCSVKAVGKDGTFPAYVVFN